jgi:hypothetical protein
MQRHPNAKLSLITPPAVEPVTLALAKQYLRVEISDDDNLVPILIQAARETCETIVNRTFVQTTRQLELDYFPPFTSSWVNTNILPALQFGVAAAGGRSLWINLEAGAIRLPMPPLIAVTSIGYTDINGNPQTINPADPTKVIVSPGTPGQIAPAFGTIFPLTRPQLSAVQIQYTAGYSADASLVPASVVMAILALTAEYYEHRSEPGECPEWIERSLNNVNWGSY